MRVLLGLLLGYIGIELVLQPSLYMMNFGGSIVFGLVAPLVLGVGIGCFVLGTRPFDRRYIVYIYALTGLTLGVVIYLLGHSHGYQACMKKIAYDESNKEFE